jgi:hypothetical protein
MGKSRREIMQGSTAGSQSVAVPIIILIARPLIAGVF